MAAVFLCFKCLFCRFRWLVVCRDFGAMTDFLLATSFCFDDIVVALYWLILSQFVKGTTLYFGICNWVLAQVCPIIIGERGRVGCHDICHHFDPHLCGFAAAILLAMIQRLSLRCSVSGCLANDLRVLALYT